MTESGLRRYSLIEGEVVGHRSYGVSFKVEGGLPGFIDKADVSDTSTSPVDWPAIGQVVTCVVLGITQDGRIRASARRSDVSLARNVENPDQALRRWAGIRDEGFESLAEREEFLASVESVPLLKWALRQRAGSLDRARAEEISSEMPEGFVGRLQ